MDFRPLSFEPIWRTWRKFFWVPRDIVNPNKYNVIIWAFLACMSMFTKCMPALASALQVELSLLILQFVAKVEFLWNFSVQVVERSCCSPGADYHQLLRTFSYSI
jgi:hypothetical protein